MIFDNSQRNTVGQFDTILWVQGNKVCSRAALAIFLFIAVHHLRNRGNMEEVFRVAQG